VPPGIKGITSAAKGEGISKMLYDLWVRSLKTEAVIFPSRWRTEINFWEWL